MRRTTVAGLRAGSVVLLFWLVIQGPDYLLVTVLDAHRWFPIGVGSGLLTLPLLWRWGVGLVPPWSMPAVSADASLRRAVGYHLCCSVLAAWLWTAPTLRLVGLVHEHRGLTGGVEAALLDVVSVAVGLLLAELLFLLAALVGFLSVASFGTDIDLRSVGVVELLRPGVGGIGSYLAAAFVLGVSAVVLQDAGVLVVGSVAVPVTLVASVRTAASAAKLLGGSPGESGESESDERDVL